MTRIPQFDQDRFQAVAIASSTGGPGHVEHILAGLPADLQIPILVAQHMPAVFTETFAHRLDTLSPLSVFHAEDGMPVLPGSVYIGKGHEHLRVRKKPGCRPEVEVNARPEELLYKPSADELFRSCAGVWGGSVLGVVLTGIGSDGREGARVLHDAGGVVLTQSAQTCAVYGMPKACVEAGVSDAELDPEKIRRAILQLSPEYRTTAGV